MANGPDNPLDPNEILAEPTKDLFVSMLVKDIPLRRAILDLVDNSLDGARRLRGNGPYAGLSVRVEFSQERFRIADNCGGIPVDVARRSAFRFGRPKDMVATTHSVGQFGVGMKRALFKLGKAFRVESTTPTSHFVVEVDVPTWTDDPQWRFEFQELQENVPQAADRVGTEVLVTELHDGIREEFRLDTFQNLLAAELAAAHQVSLNEGLAITVNTIPITYQPSVLLNSENLRPASDQIEVAGQPPVRILLYAGIGEASPQSAGWYVFCNGRLVLGPDQTIVTGWGEDQEQTIPKYHNQFRQFRGFAFFDCDDAGRLPWNTTKTGVDVDSPVYQAARQRMVRLMRPVIDFLNALDNEISQPEPHLARVVEQAQSQPVAQLNLPPQPFTVTRREDRGPRVLRITYYRPESDIEKVRAQLRADSRKEVGERTFDYYLKMECS